MSSIAYTLRSDLQTLWRLAVTRVQGQSHADRLESFYSAQAGDYDSFRRRLLHGRDRLIEALPQPAGGVWIDFGAGTGENAERFGDRLRSFDQVYLVDLCPSLLHVARQRIDANSWENVAAVEADATSWQPTAECVDLVTFSYSLTMIPDWFAAIDHAFNLLKPGGTIAVTDFYVSRKHVGERSRRHGWWTRHGWPTWFASDNVFLNPDHLPFLRSRFEEQSLDEADGSIPYLPLVRVPYYVFVGRKPSYSHNDAQPVR